MGRESRGGGGAGWWVGGACGTNLLRSVLPYVGTVNRECRVSSIATPTLIQCQSDFQPLVSPIPFLPQLLLLQGVHLPSTPRMAKWI